jgi:hypothetical protein
MVMSGYRTPRVLALRLGRTGDRTHLFALSEHR